jgi:hypothetical protein
MSGKATTKKAPKKEAPRRAAIQQPIGHPGIGAFVKGLLISGKTTDQILKAVERQFPGAHTSRASVSWYRSRLNKEMEK